MDKIIRKRLLICLEVILLAILSPKFFWLLFYSKTFNWLIMNVFGPLTILFSFLIIVGFDIVWLVMIIKQNFVRNIYVKIALIWLVLILSISLLSLLVFCHLLGAANI